VQAVGVKEAYVMKNRTVLLALFCCQALLYAMPLAFSADALAGDPLQPLFKTVPFTMDTTTRPGPDNTVLPSPVAVPAHLPRLTLPRSAATSKAVVPNKPAQKPVDKQPVKQSAVSNVKTTQNTVVTPAAVNSSTPTVAPVTTPNHQPPTGVTRQEIPTVTTTPVVQTPENNAVKSVPSVLPTVAKDETRQPASARSNPVDTPQPAAMPRPTEPVSEADKASGYEAKSSLNGSPPVEPAVAVNPISQPTGFTADQRRRLGLLNQEQSAHFQWIMDALSINQTAVRQTPTSDYATRDGLPVNRMLALAHDAKQQALWQRFHQANVQYDAALNRGRLARQQLAQAAALATPSFRVEGRALWLDRGSIVASQTPEGFKALLKHIHQLGINTLFVEALNAGYANYNSQLIPKNPLLTGDWDPMAIAVETGHQLGMEVHAWVWCFAVGNVRHNVIVNQPADYAGPILVDKGYMPEALRGSTGNLIPRKGVQHEYWLSPASLKARDFLLDAYREIVAKYRVDGLQLDYIRYPFQNSPNQMGFEGISRQRFEQETGLYLNAMDDYTLKSFIAWKTFQITQFVEQVATTLKTISPQLKISAAVYPMRRTERIVAIQQDWETWLDKGWVDFLAPMTYTPSPREYQTTLAQLKTTTQYPSIIYPGIALHRLNGNEVVRLQQISREVGWLGNTMFANAHLDRAKETALVEESYRVHPAIPPHRDPAQSVRFMVQETQQMVETLNKQGDHQFDDWAPLLKQVDAHVSAWQGMKLTAQTDAIKALQPQLNSLAQTSLKRSETSQTPYRFLWMGTQMARLHQLVGVVARGNHSISAVASAP
jgi:uncharacterized lipoprotein YddW (UPF0748 family)